jgi:hypothetical protein
VTLSQATGYTVDAYVDSTGSFYLFGYLGHCDTVDFDIQGAVLRYDSSLVDVSIHGNKTIIRSEKHPPCRTEMFRFGVHGGVLRKWLESDGEISFVLFGERYGVKFIVPEGVRTLALKVFGWNKS